MTNNETTWSPFSNLNTQRDLLSKHKAVLQCASCRSIVGDTSDIVALLAVNGMGHISLSASTGVTVKSMDPASQETENRTNEHSTPKKSGKKSRRRSIQSVETNLSLVDMDPTTQCYSISCEFCSSSIGRMYADTEQPSSGTTKKHSSNDPTYKEVLKHIKNTFCFDLGKVDRYYFGSAELRIQGAPAEDAEREPSLPDRNDNIQYINHDDAMPETANGPTKSHGGTDHVTLAQYWHDIEKVREEIAMMQQVLAAHDDELGHHTDKLREHGSDIRLLLSSLNQNLHHDGRT